MAAQERYTTRQASLWALVSREKNSYLHSLHIVGNPYDPRHATVDWKNPRVVTCTQPSHDILLMTAALPDHSASGRGDCFADVTSSACPRHKLGCSMAAGFVMCDRFRLLRRELVGLAAHRMLVRSLTDCSKDQPAQTRKVDAKIELTKHGTKHRRPVRLIKQIRSSAASPTPRMASSSSA